MRWMRVCCLVPRHIANAKAPNSVNPDWRYGWVTLGLGVWSLMIPVC